MAAPTSVLMNFAGMASLTMRALKIVMMATRPLVTDVRLHAELKYAVMVQGNVRKNAMTAIWFPVTAAPPPVWMNFVATASSIMAGWRPVMTGIPSPEMVAQRCAGPRSAGMA